MGGEKSKIFFLTKNIDAMLKMWYKFCHEKKIIMYNIKIFTIMKEKIKQLQKCMADIGLTQDEVMSYWQQKAQSSSKKLQVKELAVVNPDFPASDIRSQAKLFWYAFEGGTFSPDPNAYPNCQGVVGWINPDLNAPEGNKIYVVLPEQMCLPYSNEYCLTGADDLHDGRANTLKLIEYGKKHNIRFQAAEFAFNYCQNGVKQGEAFLPAIKQSKLVAKNCEGVSNALNLIGGIFEGWLWSSSEDDYSYAWVVNANDGVHDWGDKNDTSSVSCLLAY